MVWVGCRNKGWTRQNLTDWLRLADRESTKGLVDSAHWPVYTVCGAFVSTHDLFLLESSDATGSVNGP